MSKEQFENNIGKELERLNQIIDHKIIHGVRYDNEAKKHRRLIIQGARAERKRQRFGNFMVQMFSFMF